MAVKKFFDMNKRLGNGTEINCQKNGNNRDDA